MIESHLYSLRPAIRKSGAKISSHGCDPTERPSFDEIVVSIGIAAKLRADQRGEIERCSSNLLA